MDIPSKFSLRAGLLGLGATALSTAIKLGRRSYAQASRDPPFANSVTMAPSKRPASRPNYRRKRSYVRTTVPRPIRSWRSMRRANASAQVMTGTAISNGYRLSPQLAFIPNSDLLGAYRQYRIRKVVFRMTPRVDPASAGLVNNFQFQVSAANFVEGGAAIPTSVNDIMIYDNYYTKYVNSGEDFVYTFYPKVTNSVQGPTVPIASGSYATNPWLKMDATGITVPHEQLLVYVQTGLSPSPTVISWDGFIEIFFDVKS